MTIRLKSLSLRNQILYRRHDKQVVDEPVRAVL